MTSLGDLLRKHDREFSHKLEEQRRREVEEERRRDAALRQKAIEYISQLQASIVKDAADSSQWNSEVRGLRYVIRESDEDIIRFVPNSMARMIYNDEVWTAFNAWLHKNGLNGRLNEEFTTRYCSDGAFPEHKYYEIIITPK